MGRLEVTAAAVVLPTVDGREQYLYKGAIVESEAFTADGVEHARTQGLIGDAAEVVEEETPVVFSQADVDAAVKAAVDAKAVELRKEHEAELEKVKAPAAKAPAAPKRGGSAAPAE